VHLIREARTSIEVQTFIWSDDESGRLLIYELIEAARRGVKVRIIADHMVSDQDPATVAFLTTVHPNFQLKHYRPAMARIKPSRFQTILAGLWSFHGVNQRMHNKLMVFDGTVMITGGRNIENTYFDHSTGMNFRDRDVLGVGPVARAAAESFEQFWNFRHAVPGAELKDVAAVIASGRYPRHETRADYDFGPFFGELEGAAVPVREVAERFAARLRPVVKATFIGDDPGKTGGFFTRDARITLELRRALAGAKRSVVMQTPYLILSGPAQKLVRELHTQNPGLSIRISSNSFASTDNLLAYSANYRLRGVYVDELKLQVHEFRPQPASLRELFPRYDTMAKLAAAKGDKAPFLCIHAKSLVVDDRLAFIGSYNLDPRSENLNTEIGLMVEDEGFARELREEIEQDLRPENSWVIAKRRLPLHLGTVNALLDGFLSRSPVDIWPIQNTSSFELRPGAMEVPPGHPDFHKHYREAGAFPGTEGLFTQKEILTRLYKAVGTPLTPHE
jgi:putative cardiolipin synthase